MKTLRFKLLIILYSGLFFCSPLNARCLNTETPSCSVYESCFADLCPCFDSEYEYFTSYGKKYCEAFLDLSTLSSAGKLWRDATLRCLQEKIVPILPINKASDNCECESIQTKSFDFHVSCYTQSHASICDLPVGDWWEILEATEPVKNLKDSKSRKQMLEVAKICYPQVKNDTKEALVKIIDLLD